MTNHRPSNSPETTDETIGANLLLLFEMAPDDTVAEKTVIAMRGAVTVLGAMLTSEPAQRIYEGMLINAGLPPKALEPGFEAAEAAMNAYWTPQGGAGQYDLERAAAAKAGQAALDNLDLQRVTEYVEMMEMADISAPEIPIRFRETEIMDPAPTPVQTMEKPRIPFLGKVGMTTVKPPIGIIEGLSAITTVGQPKKKKTSIAPMLAGAAVVAFLWARR